MTSPWWALISQFVDGLSERQFAAKIDVTPATVGRWRKGSVPDTDLAVAVARRCGIRPIDALVATGTLTEIEAEEYRSETISVRSLGTSAIVDELQRRLDNWKVLDESTSVEEVFAKKIAKGFRQ